MKKAAKKKTSGRKKKASKKTAKASRRKATATADIKAAAEELEEDLARSAMAKRAAGQKTTQEERRALLRLERRREESLRWEYYQRVPWAHFQRMAGRKRDTLRDHAERYGLPTNGKIVDLCAYVRRVHEFLAESWHIFARGEEVGEEEALERQRTAQAIRIEIENEIRMGSLLHVSHARKAFGIVIAQLRHLGGTLQQAYGEEARELVDAAIDAIGDESRSLFEEEEAGGAEHDDEEA